MQAGERAPAALAARAVVVETTPPEQTEPAVVAVATTAVEVRVL
jgi:hypothetical protein